MKYLKHYYVEYANQSNFLIYSNSSPTGKTHPPLPGLDVKIWATEPHVSVDYCLSVCPDTTPIPSVTGLEELTFAQWADAAETYFNLVKTDSQAVMDKTNIDTVLSAFSSIQTLTDEV